MELAFLDEQMADIQKLVRAKNIVIPVSDITALHIKEDTPLKDQQIIIGMGEFSESFNIVRRNPPSKRNPNGSITIRKGTGTKTFRIEEQMS